MNIEIGEFFTKFLSSSRSLIVVGDPMMDALSLLPLLLLLLPLFAGTGWFCLVRCETDLVGILGARSQIGPAEYPFKVLATEKLIALS